MKKLLILVLAVSCSFCTVSFAATINVPANYATIQAAVNAALPGDTINIAAGTYQEQVEITKNLNIVGAGKDVTIVQSPATLTKSFTTGSNVNKPIIYIHDIPSMSIAGLTVNGLGRGNANIRFIGIGLWNAGGTVENIHITGVRDTPFSGAQHGVSIYAYNSTGGPYTINVDDVNVDDMQKTGIALMGPGLTANVTNCTITGNGHTTVTAQNGIQIGYDATGSIVNCEVSGMWYDGPSWSASGILLYYPGSRYGVKQ